jgi:hypothetical protein
MGLLVEQPIPTLFGGVSRQPDSVRQENQLQDLTNALASVVTGGFEKRPPTQMIADLSGFVSAANDYSGHAIDRDSTEQYFLLANSTSIIALDAITGTQKTVTIGDSTRHFLIDESGLDSTGIVQIDGANMSIQCQFDSGETAFAWTWALSDATTGRFKVEGSADGSSWVDLQTNIGGAASGSFSTTIGSAGANDHNYIRVNITTGMAGSSDTLTLKATFKDKGYLLGADTDDLRFATVADTTFLVNRTVTTRMAEAGTGSLAGTVQTFSDLPTSGVTANDIYKILGDDTDDFGVFYVKATGNSPDENWEETVAPDAVNDFDVSSLPYEITRAADGTFTFKAATWDSRTVGDGTITEQPSFIGKAIQDVAFFRNRLAIVADEKVYTSRTGDVFNLWPQKATSVLDSDPVTRAATTVDVNILRFATTFRKVLFVTGERNQFELSATEALTPEKSVFDLTTSYAASPIGKPVTAGDNLYFPAKSNNHAIVYEYFFDEASLNNTAADVTKHVVDYIPNDILLMTSDPATGTLFVLTTGEQNSVFVYRTFFDDNEKLQSAWAKYTFGATESDAFVHTMAVMSSFLVLVIERDDGAIYLEQMPVEREEQDSTVGFSAFLDQREALTGTYDSTNGFTHWTLKYEHSDDAEIVTGADLSEPGAVLTTLYPDRYLLTLSTVLAGETIIINSNTYTAHATTTTTANKEFSISGNDTADAGELVTCINDADDGVSGVTATDNGDGTITLNVDDRSSDTITAPTGTAIDNSTITAVEEDDVVAAEGDYSAGACWVGRPYTMTATLSQIYRRARDDRAIITGRLQLKDITFLLEKTGYLKATVTPESRTAYNYTFEGKVLGSSTLQVGSSSIEEEATFKVPIYAKSDAVTISLTNDQPLPSIVTAAAWRGFFNELSRQE